MRVNLKKDAKSIYVLNFIESISSVCKYYPSLKGIAKPMHTYIEIHTKIELEKRLLGEGKKLPYTLQSN